MREGFSQRVMEFTDGRGVDLVLDHIASLVWKQCLASIKTRERFINCGVRAGYRVELHMDS